MDIFWTIISGVLVFALSQLVIEYYLKPIQDYKALKGKIAYALVYYACYYCNPRSASSKDDMWNETSDALRKLSAETMAFAQIKPKSNIFIPSKNKLLKVKDCLMRMSNSCFDTNCTRQNYDSQKKIYDFLKIEKYSRDKE